VELPELQSSYGSLAILRGTKSEIPMAHDRVNLNVGGKRFVTSRTTLANAGRGSMLAAVIDENWQLVPDVASNELFIDRNPTYFSVLLDLLRTGELHVPPGMLNPQSSLSESYCILNSGKDAIPL